MGTHRCQQSLNVLHFMVVALLVLLCQIDEFPNGFGSDHF